MEQERLVTDLCAAMTQSDAIAEYEGIMIANSIVEDNGQEAFVDADITVLIFDEAQFLEFVHEKIYARPRCANHFCQRLLRYVGDHFLGLVLLAIARKQQQNTR